MLLFYFTVFITFVHHSHHIAGIPLYTFFGFTADFLLYFYLIFSCLNRTVPSLLGHLNYAPGIKNVLSYRIIYGCLLQMLKSMNSDLWSL